MAPELANPAVVIILVLVMPAVVTTPALVMPAVVIIPVLVMPAVVIRSGFKSYTSPVAGSWYVHVEASLSPSSHTSYPCVHLPDDPHQKYLAVGFD